MFALIISIDGIETINTNYSKIESIVINEGIKETENGMYNESTRNFFGTFFYIGFDFEKGEYSTKIDIGLPSTLEKIGDLSFCATNIDEINISYNVSELGLGSFMASTISKISFDVEENGTNNLKTIGGAAFNGTQLTEIEIPYSVTYIGDEAFKLASLEKVTFLGDLEDTTNQLAIGNYAFNANLNYTTKENPLIIPARVTSIGDGAFGYAQYNSNLKFIKFMGSSEALNKLGTNWYKTNVVEYIKSKDEY